MAENKPHICLIPGLGAGPEVFDRLDTGDLPRTCIQWIRPERGEDLPTYAARLMPQIPKSDKLILIGVSFGGMLAVELAHQLSPRLTLLVSSIETPTELPLLYRILGQLRLDVLLPVDLLIRLHPALFYFFGIKQKMDKELLLAMLAYTDAAFIKWAMRSILQWKLKARTGNLIRIHGGADRLLPAPKSPDTILIPNGGHLMIRTHARELNPVIQQLIDDAISA